MASVEEASADRKERTKKLPQEIKQAHEELEKLAEKQQIEPYHDTLRIEKLDKEFDVFKWKSRANVEDKAAATEIDPNAQQYFYRACTMEEAHLWLDSRSQEDAIAKEGQPWASYADYSEKYLDGVDRNILLEVHAPGWVAVQQSIGIEYGKSEGGDDHSWFTGLTKTAGHSGAKDENEALKDVWLQHDQRVKKLCEKYELNSDPKSLNLKDQAGLLRGILFVDLIRSVRIVRMKLHTWKFIQKLES